ncbi:uncharacterized protein LOC126838091 [Adelges cooleyi]|uniref:uncharacterized protein LOC126838091 n=1 Tax=Adelges cooleyi TaxID=133065 RepID=UPI00217F4B3F|nr:uncharacterized protein LOC126838091 [Adelges cooleyi]XP_050428168.1 uncharacterized protein LOC126838091 [Adelges cooleyi]
MAVQVESNILDSFMNLTSKNPIWKIELPYSPVDVDDDPENVDILCEMVRNQYLKHLRQILYDNLDVGPKGYQKECLYQIDQCVETCVTEMEKKALKRCLIASIYRETMSSMINEVKNCTKNSTVYALLQQLIESENQLECLNKCIEDKSSTKQLVSVGVNTEIQSVTLQPLKIEGESHLNSSLISNKIINQYDDICDVTNLKTSPKSHNIDEDGLKINSNPKRTEPEIFSDSNVVLEHLTNLSPLNEFSINANYKCDTSQLVDSKIKSKQVNDIGSSTKDILGVNSLLKDLQDSPVHNKHLTLEEQLIALGLTAVDDTESVKNLPSSTTQVHTTSKLVMRSKRIKETLKNKLKCERVAKSYELQRSMVELPQELQTRLNYIFDDLFGTGHNYEPDPLTEEEEKIIAHKRIVKLVVDYMTPYYKARRINRNLFKTLAKFISQNLMDRTYGPDEEIIAKAVEEFFTGNKCIKTLEDVYN